MKLLIIRDNHRMSEVGQNFVHFCEDGIDCTVCTANILDKMPAMELDLVLVDLMRQSLEKEDVSFLSALKNHKYGVAVAMADAYENVEYMKSICNDYGIEHYIERPMRQEDFYDTLDKLLKPLL